MPKSVFPAAAHTVDPRVERVVRALLLVGLALVLLLPGARGHSQWLGWAPLWLVGMPAAAWGSLHRFRLPQRQASALGSRPPARRRRPGSQACRRAAPLLQRWPRAA